VVQSGTPQELYRHPRDAFAARFLGLSNVLEGEIVAARDGLAVDTAIGSVPLPDAMATAPGGPATVLLRPDAVALSATGAESGQGSPPTAGSPVLTLFGRVREISFRGPQVHVVVDLAGTDLIVVVSSSGDLPTQGETVRLDVDLKRGVQRLA
jgi:ABC-type Fe3+/spermidine/putrescine transport system ATPase subunit